MKKKKSVPLIPNNNPAKPQFFELLLLHIKMIVTLITIYSNIISIILKSQSEAVVFSCNVFLVMSRTLSSL